MLSISPGLWIVATPLGEPADLSPRAREILVTADIVLAEDTRRASWLFRNLDLYVKQLVSFHDHNEQKLLHKIGAWLEEKKIIALVSDAGTPLLADPGFRLVQYCRENNFPVHPVPGPSAPIAAISVAGIAPIPFSFLGFLPRDHAGKVKLFRSFRDCPGSMIFFERKDRLKESLTTAYEILGDRPIAICRELTKEHEEIICGNLVELAQTCPEYLGEITVVIGPGIASFRLECEQASCILQEILKSSPKIRQAVAKALPECPGWTSSELYKLASNLRKHQNDL